MRGKARDELLPPELLDELADLEWVTRMVARGMGGGIHRSVFVGAGEEFERHRPYQQGDDLRHLDWRLLARTDRAYVRRFRESSNLHAMIVVDASPSMDFAGHAGGGVGKLRYATFLAAALGHLLRSAGDLPGLLVTGGRGGQPAALLPPRAGPEPWRRLLVALDQIAPGHPGPLAPALETVGSVLVRGGRVVVLSDFLEDDAGAALARSAAHLRARGDEVTAIRILTPEELAEEGGEDALYHDPEDPGLELPGSPDRDPRYRAALDRYYAELARLLTGHGVVWHEVRTTDPLLPLLRSWFQPGDRAPRG
ncbi:MAG: DUF58 domain-containing protein [Gemmatimonadota bacterium]